MQPRSSALPTIPLGPATVIVLAVLVTAGCTAASSSAETATLAAVSPSTETGTATLTDTASGTTTISITTEGGTDTGVQSVAMRAGTCGSDGAVYQLLNDVQEDESITTVPVDLSAMTGGKYYIEIHSSTDVSTTVACGEIP